MKRLKLLFCALLLSGSVFAQLRDLSIEIESGGSFYATGSVDKPYIRKDNIYYDSENPSISCRYGIFFSGFKLQLKSPNERWKFSSGLRFIQTQSHFAKSSDQDSFYFLYQQTSNSIDYLRVKSIDQVTGYIGIPLEARFFMSPKPRKFRLFFTMGTQLGYKLNTKTNVTFADANMNSFASTVQSTIEQPSNFLSTIYGGAGFEFHKGTLPLMSLTLILPSGVISNHEQLVKPNGGVGFQLSFQLPFKKSKQ